jgi:flagellar biosynthesis protein FlhA
MADNVKQLGVIFGFNLQSLARHTDIAFAFGIIMIMVILLMPMPRFMMDFLLALSITLSVLILMTSLFIQKPLEFSSFPTVLLVSTMIRLSLNVASTRLILSNGHEGPQAAGKVIEAFGEFVMGGNFIIGLIVFAILIIVNFVVITKGSGRIAEVSARFSLDAMPGKQMAIDADLSSGLINEAEAKQRRKDLENESNFFGAMDGAAKFVRGDAVAGLLITFINIIGGVIIGVFQNHMSFLNATESYTILTVGDGLVTQIPALIVSTAAGLLVSKAGIEGTTDRALFGQLSAYPSALGMSAFLSGALSLMPGLPLFPFLLLAVSCGFGSWSIQKRKKEHAANQHAEKEEQTRTEHEQKTKEKAQESITSAPPIDILRIELGFGLLGLVN